MARFQDKQPAEEYYVTATFRDLGAEEISSYDILILDEAGDDVTATIIDTTKTVASGNDITMWLRGGESNTEYVFEFTVTGSLGSIFEKEATLYVLDTVR